MTQHFDSVYEITTAIDSVKKQHFWEWFSGSKLKGGESYYSDLSTTDGWVTNDNQFAVSTANKRIDVSIRTSDSQDNPIMSRDLGVISDEQFVLRFKMIISGIGAPGNYDFSTFFCLSNKRENANTSQDAIGMLMTVRTNGQKYWWCFDTNDASPFNGSNNNPPAQGQTQSSHTPTTGTWYVEIVRDSKTAYHVDFFANADYTGSISGFPIAGTITSGQTTDLKFLNFVFRDDSGHSNGSLDAKISDIEVYNGMVSPVPLEAINLISDTPPTLMTWGTTDRDSSNHRGSGMSDSGYIVQGSSGGGSAQQTILSFMDKKPFSNTGSVAIFIAKLAATGTSKQGGWGMCGDMPSYWLNGLKVNVPQTGNIGFYTMDNSTEYLTDTQVAVSTASSYHTYKLEQLDGTSKCSIDGVLKSDVSTGQSTTAMQPFVYSKFDDSAVHVQYCEAWNT
jgi:hypothetical protein